MTMYLHRTSTRHYVTVWVTVWDATVTPWLFLLVDKGHRQGPVLVLWSTFYKICSACSACRHTACKPHCLWPAFVIVDSQGETHMSPDSLFVSVLIKLLWLLYLTWCGHFLSSSLISRQVWLVYSLSADKGGWKWSTITNCTLQL